MKRKTVKSLYKKQYDVIHKHVKDFFKDSDKATFWMVCPNTALGGISPIEMLITGRSDKLMRFVLAQLDDTKLNK